MTLTLTIRCRWAGRSTRPVPSTASHRRRRVPLSERVESQHLVIDQHHADDMAWNRIITLSSMSDGRVKMLSSLFNSSFILLVNSLLSIAVQLSNLDEINQAREIRIVLLLTLDHLSPCSLTMSASIQISTHSQSRVWLHDALCASRCLCTHNDVSYHAKTRLHRSLHDARSALKCSVCN